MMGRWWPYMLLLALLGCEETTTEVVVVVDTNYEVPAQLDRVVFTVQRTGSSLEPSTVTAQLQGGDLADDFPLTLGLVPGADGVRQISVTVQGFGPTDGDTPTVERRAVVSFIEGRVLTLTMHLIQSCARDMCPGGTTCTELSPRCQSEQRSDLKPWSGGPPALEETFEESDEVPGATDPDPDDPPTPDAGPMPPDDPPTVGDTEPNGRALQVVAGGNFACALMESGRVYCWGDNRHGQLGDDTLDHGTQACASGGDCARTPVEVEGLNTAVAIAAGGTFACAIRLDNRAVCWGDNGFGQLGHPEGGEFAIVPAPKQVLQRSTGAVLEGVQEIAGGSQHMCLRATGLEMACVGQDVRRQLGLGTPTVEFNNNGVQPVAILGGQQVLAIAPGGTHTCAELGDSVRCWGDNDVAQTSFPAAGPMEVRPDPQEVSLNAIGELQCGDSHCCAIVLEPTEGFPNIKCWGADGFGQLGREQQQTDCYGYVGHLCDGQPSYVHDSAGLVFSDLSLGFEHSCAITGDGTVACWGRADSGQLGRQSASFLLPGLVPAVTNAVGIAAGKAHSCAVDMDGQVWCWGVNDQGQLGLGDLTDTPTPMVVPIPERAPLD